MILAQDLRIQSILAGKSQQKKFGSFSFTVLCLAQFILFMQPGFQPNEQCHSQSESSLTIITLVKIISYNHIKRQVSQVILALKLTIDVNHYKL